jgi:hypothetical protein
MRLTLRPSAAIALALFLWQASRVCESAEETPTAAEMAALIRQLGHAEYAERQAASRALEGIGSPALEALRAAANDGDAEVRVRAKKIVHTITARLQAEVAREALAKCDGEWTFGGQNLRIHDQLWESSAPGSGTIRGTLKAIEVRQSVVYVDLFVDTGSTEGSTCKMIFRLDGDTLHYCGAYDAQRPTEFKSDGPRVYVAWKRSRAADPPKAAK